MDGRCLNKHRVSLASCHSFIPIPYINNATQRPYSIRSVDDITPHRRGILHDAARDHDDILGVLRKLLDDEVYHLPEGGIFILEQLGDAEEEGGGFGGGELLAGKEEECDLGEEYTAAAGGDGGGVEDARWYSISSSALGWVGLGWIGLGCWCWQW